MSPLSDHPPLAYQPITPTNLKTCGLLERPVIAHCCQWQFHLGTLTEVTKEGETELPLMNQAEL
jgi:hypothetical protein